MIKLQAFFVAAALLSRLPVPKGLLPADFSQQLKSQSVLFYPLVGLVLGLVLVALACILPAAMPGLMKGTIVVAAWVYLTGALHLDGLSDSIDAACAFHKEPDKTLQVFRDPHVGPMAVIALVLMILLKVSLMASLAEWNASLFLALIVAAVFSRLLAVLYMQSTPYARSEGIAADLQLAHLQPAILIQSAVCISLLWLFSGTAIALSIIILLSIWLYYWRSFWNVRVGGYTGDTVGALIEMAEVLTLMVFVWSRF